MLGGVGSALESSQPKYSTKFSWLSLGIRILFTNCLWLLDLNLQDGSPPKKRFRANVFDWDTSQHLKVSNNGGKSTLYLVFNEDLANPKLTMQDWLYSDPFWKLA